MLNRKFKQVSADILTLNAKGSIVSKSKAGGVAIRGVIVKPQPTPATMTTVASITAAKMLGGIILATPAATGSTVAYTLPTGTLMEAAVEFAVNDSFDWTIINKALAAADTITVTASTDHTLEGVSIISSLHTTIASVSGNVASFRTRKVSAGVFETYRIA